MTPLPNPVTTLESDAIRVSSKTSSLSGKKNEFGVVEGISPVSTSHGLGELPSPITSVVFKAAKEFEELNSLN